MNPEEAQLPNPNWQARLVDYFNRAENRFALEDEASKVNPCDGAEPNQVQEFVKQMELVAQPQRLAVFNRTARGSLLRTGLRWLEQHQANPIWENFRAHILQSFVSPDVAHARQRELRSCNRLPGEAVLSYNRRFRELADDAYPLPRNEEQTSMLIQEYARGLRDDRLKERIVTPNRPDTLDVAMQRVQAIETKVDNMAWLGLTHEPMEIGALLPEKPFATQTKATAVPSAMEKEVHYLKTQYGKLESKIDRLLQNTPARNRETRTCNFCGIVGHISRNCRKRQKQQQRQGCGQSIGAAHPSSA